MKGRQVIATEKSWGFDELLRFLRDRWDESVSVLPKEFNSRPIIGRYIVLPGTPKFCIMVYPNKKGVVLMTYPTDDEHKVGLADTASGLFRPNIGGALRSRAREKERVGPAEDVLLMYTEYVRGLLEKGRAPRSGLNTNHPF